MVMTVFFEHEWLPWKFAVSPKNYWKSQENRRKFMDWAGRELSIKEMKDWYQISRQVKKICFYAEVKQSIVDLGGNELLHSYEGVLPKLLSGVYPEFEWEPFRFKVVTTKNWELVLSGKITKKL